MFWCCSEKLLLRSKLIGIIGINACGEKHCLELDYQTYFHIGCDGFYYMYE